MRAEQRRADRALHRGEAETAAAVVAEDELRIGRAEDALRVEQDDGVVGGGSVGRHADGGRTGGGAAARLSASRAAKLRGGARERMRQAGRRVA